MKKIKRNNFRKNLIAAALLCLAISTLIFTACGPPRSFERATPTPVPESERLSDLERDLKTMRTAEFKHIYLFRRKDSGELDGEDKKFLKANSPRDTNRFIVTDKEKAVIAGSNYKFEEEILKKLSERFNVENYSPPETETNSNESSVISNSNN